MQVRVGKAAIAGWSEDKKPRFRATSLALVIRWMTLQMSFESDSLCDAINCLVMT
jgi:hypothetical protein